MDSNSKNKLLKSQHHRRLSKFQTIPEHVLKFMLKGNHHTEKGIICFPEQTYGISKGSPQEFIGSTTVSPLKGYVYQHQNKPQFKYYSQKRYFSIDHQTNESLSKQIHFEDPENPFKFHRKKGLLSQFVDQNALMCKTTKLMGFERDEVARKLSNRDREKRIASIKPQKQYINLTAREPNRSGEYFQRIGSLTRQKLRIRKERNVEAKEFSKSIQLGKRGSLDMKKVSQFDKESMKQKMYQTSREWSLSRHTKNEADIFSQTLYTTRVNQFMNKVQGEKQKKQYRWVENHEQNLENWYNTTCSSKWTYKRKSESSSEEDLNQS